MSMEGKRTWKYSIHLLDLPVVDLHAVDHIRKECNHIVIAHGHIGHDLLEGHLLECMILIFFDPIAEFQAELCNFPL